MMAILLCRRQSKASQNEGKTKDSEYSSKTNGLLKVTFIGAHAIRTVAQRRVHMHK